MWPGVPVSTRVCVCVYSEELWWLCWCIFLRCEFHICNTVLVHISSLRESCLSSLVGAEGFRNIFSIHLDLIELLSRIDCWSVPTKLLVELARSSQIGATFKSGAFSHYNPIQLSVSLSLRHLQNMP